MKSLIFLFLLLVPLSAATTFNQTFQVSTLIPDNSIIGIANTQGVISQITQISNIQVSLSLTGGWNGDIYAYLVHGGGFAVLLNRPGRSLGSLDGVGSSGMNVIFSDAAALDVHNALPLFGFAAGVYQPDARNTDPGSVLATDNRSAFLSSFSGLDPNGAWTLFIADLSPGATSVFQSWSLEIQGVPEPTTALLTVVGVLLLLKRCR